MARSGSWFDPTRWTPAAVPTGPNATAGIGLPGTYTVTIDGNFPTVGTLGLDAPSATLRFTGAGTGSPTLLATTFSIFSGTFEMQAAAGRPLYLNRPDAADLNTTAFNPVGVAGTFRTTGTGAAVIDSVQVVGGGGLELLNPDVEVNSVSNSGTVTVGPNVDARVSPLNSRRRAVGVGSFTQSAGSLMIHDSASFTMMRGAAFNYTGGQVSGLVQMDSRDDPNDVAGTLTVGAGVTAGSGTFASRSGLLSVSGNLAPGMTALLDAVNGGTLRFTDVSAVNRGNIIIRPTNPAPGVSYAGGSVTSPSVVRNEGTISFEQPAPAPGVLNVVHEQRSPLENRATGIFNVTGLYQGITQPVTNFGSFNVKKGENGITDVLLFNGDPFVDPTFGELAFPAFTQGGGALVVHPDAIFTVAGGNGFSYQGGNVVGTVNCSTLRMGTNVTGGGTFASTGGTLTVRGSTSAAMRLDVSGANLGLVMDGGAINRATVLLRPTASPTGATIRSASATTAFFNEGTFSFEPLGAFDALHTLRGPFENRAGGTLLINSSTNVTGTADVINRGAVVASDGSTLIIDGAFRQSEGQLAGQVRVNSGSLSYEGGTSDIPRLELAGGSTSVAPRATLNAQRVVSGGGASITVLAGAGARVGGGTLNVGPDGYDASSAAGNSTLTLEATTEIGAGPGRLVLNGDVRHLNPQTASILTTTPAGSQSAGVIDLAGGVRTFNVDVPLASPAAATLNISADIGNGGVVKTGRHQLSLTGNNTFARGLTVRSGLVRIYGANGMSGGVRVLATQDGMGALAIDRDGALGVSGNPVTLAGGSLALSGSFAVTHPITLGSQDDSAGTIAVSAGLPASLDAPVTGSGGLNVVGGGVLKLNAINTYTGTTRVIDGTLVIGAAAAVVNPRSLFEIGGDGALQLEGPEKIVGALYGDGLVSLDGTTLNLGANGVNPTFRGTITGAGQLVHVLSAGLTTLSGPLATGTGGVRVDGGELVLEGPNTFVGNVTVNSGGQLTARGSSALGDERNLVSLAGGTLQFDGTFTRAINIGLVDSLKGGGISVRRNGGAGKVTLTRPLAGSGDLTLKQFVATEPTPGGTLELATANPAFTGAIKFETGAGRLMLSRAGTLPGVTRYTVERDATLAVDERNADLNRVADAATLTMRGGTINYAGVTPASVELMGSLFLELGTSSIVLGDGSGTGGGTLTFGGLSRADRDPVSGLGGGRLDIQNPFGKLGFDYQVKVNLPPLADGTPQTFIVPSWVSVDGNLAKYDDLYGIVPQSFTRPSGSGGVPVPEPSHAVTLLALTATTLLYRGKRVRGRSILA